MYADPDVRAARTRSVETIQTVVANQPAGGVLSFTEWLICEALRGLSMYTRYRGALLYREGVCCTLGSKLDQHYVFVILGGIC